VHQITDTGSLLGSPAASMESIVTPEDPNLCFELALYCFRLSVYMIFPL